MGGLFGDKVAEDGDRFTLAYLKKKSNSLAFEETPPLINRIVSITNV